MDLKYFFLGTLMIEYTYICIPITTSPQEIIDQYNLLALVHNGFVMTEVRRGMYGLPQAGILANTQLCKILSKYGYDQCNHTYFLYYHRSRNTTFTLVINGLRIKYTDNIDLQYFITTIHKIYTAIIDVRESFYCGLIIQCDYYARHVAVLITGYIFHTLISFLAPC